MKLRWKRSKVTTRSFTWLVAMGSEKARRIVRRCDGQNAVGDAVMRSQIGDRVAGSLTDLRWMIPRPLDVVDVHAASNSLHARVPIGKLTRGASLA